MLKKLLSAGLFVMMGTATVQASGLKVGTVDLQKALQEVKKGKDARSTLEKEFNERKSKIEAEQTTLKKAQADLEKLANNVTLSQSAKEKKVAEFQKKAAAFQELVQRSQMEMQTREAELTRPIIEGLRGLVAEVAKNKKMDLVFEANSVGPTGVASNPLLFAEEKADLTPDVIKAFDSKN
jgi:outer membrane protein